LKPKEQIRKNRPKIPKGLVSLPKKDMLTCCSLNVPNQHVHVRRAAWIFTPHSYGEIIGGLPQTHVVVVQSEFQRVGYKIVDFQVVPGGSLIGKSQVARHCQVLILVSAR
jgi:hypothetical protein